MEQKEFDRLSYALGLSMGNNFRASGIDKIDVDSFADGVAAVFYGAQPKMTYDEAKQVIQEYFQKLEARQQEEAKVASEANAKAGRDFLDANGKREEVKVTPSGLQYEVLKEGDGAQPTATDRVVVHYTGKLIDGTVFDSSEERGEPATFGVTQVIPGWVEALQMMKARPVIPDSLPAASQQAFIDSVAALPGARQLPSGVVVVTEQAGTGDFPTDSSTVMARYTGRFSNGFVFDSTDEPVALPVGELVAGFSEGLKLMQPGGRYRLVIPADKGYGPRGVAGHIPGNAALDFTIDVSAIKPN